MLFNAVLTSQNVKSKIKKDVVYKNTFMVFETHEIHDDVVHSVGQDVRINYGEGKFVTGVLRAANFKERDGLPHAVVKVDFSGYREELSKYVNSVMQVVSL